MDYDSADNPRGVELLCVSQGVILHDLPMCDKIEKQPKKFGIKAFA